MRTHRRTHFDQVRLDHRQPRAQRREQALAIREPYGVWGGLSEEDRAAIFSHPRRTEAAIRRTQVG